MTNELKVYFLRFPVITTCLLPKPNGPFIVQEGSQMIVNFKNIFSETKTFCWYVENPAFSVDSSTAMLESKQVSFSLHYNKLICY